MPKNQTSPSAESQPLTAEQWAAGNGSLQVPLAGLLASEPKLPTAELLPDDWQKLLDKYLNSPRPPLPKPERADEAPAGPPEE